MAIHDLTPITYLCIASEFNLPELEACLAMRPSHLILIVSDFPKAQQGAKRLAAVLKTELPGVQIHRPDTEAALNGEDIAAVLHWVASTLKPYLSKHTPTDNASILNFTGGTKALSMALLTSLDCQQLHYKGIGQNKIQVLQLHNNQWQSDRAPLLPVTASPLQVARLYAGDVRVGGGLRDSEHLTGPLAAALWEGLEQREPGLLQLFDALERIWSAGRDNPAYKRADLELLFCDFLQDEKLLPSMHAWLQQFSALAPRQFRLEASRLILPGNGARKSGKDLRKWICGDWLEELAFLWLKEAGIPPEHMARGVVVSDEITGVSETGRETDLFVHHEGISYLVEIKADLPPETEIRSVEHQLSSLGNRLGKTRKLLFIGPQFREKLSQKKHWDLFEARFEGSEITLCSDRNSLLQALKLT
ncbi:hypothetical protein A8C75_06705 [Marinobacterium aestuarii]|uniref:Uncharacterized protein n=1 Tax=Marinobacterium aestuarii TaxID=1821621 RepID=A0A1A9EWM1_9GAMM|nr:hypothetical protein A8C75_06705 [Marinobacterium aestuarii]